MSNKLLFASTINDLNDNLPKSRGDCFDYGSWYGCNKDCPQFLRGECENVTDVLELIDKNDIEELIEEFIENDCYKEEMLHYI